MSHLTRHVRRGLSVAAVAGIATTIAAGAARSALAAGATGSVVVDTGQLVVRGTNYGDLITLRVPSTDTSVVEIDFGDDGTAERTVKQSDFGQIRIGSFGGNDIVRIDYGTQTQPFTIVDTGDGDDTAFGGSGNELFRTGAGNDIVDGNRGVDTALLGAGNDAFIWDAGDGSDVIEGGRGQDTMVFNGAAGAEKFNALANGQRLRFTRNVGNVIMDTDDVEGVTVNALGGPDSVTVGDLRGTDVGSVDIDLGAQAGVHGGDRADDSVAVTGTAGNDRIRVAGTSAGVRVSGLKAAVNISNAEPTDQLIVDALTGHDKITSKLGPGSIDLITP